MTQVHSVSTSDPLSTPTSLPGYNSRLPRFDPFRLPRNLTLKNDAPKIQTESLFASEKDVLFSHPLLSTMFAPTPTSCTYKRKRSIDEVHMYQQ